ncbi:hypothetical protein CLG96_06235 [Sphingomonas oleivorans]|uniref:Caspase family p20 domain-containing protein n=1 Tax=Sphingomonas oleivorans TaxID=1735121 RepID=A0A2T5FZL9_9SPHN|nr:caspase family protein [Sphingomonas oleivorans]PTQ12154.1 hypothetical protein CLG96_06235 [Sphingomonas oleivorans]
MSGRALLAIGCNDYDHLSSLTGAEADATGIFEALIKPDVGDYDTARSRLLLSPTLQEVREALTAMLFGAGTLDTLAIAFAGHGAVSGGSFYMATRDSRLQGLSATALSLADLFRMIAEATPKQTYLVIDACQSGGLISDLNVILKSEVMGEFGTPGVTLLATAASDEEAIEVGGHGIGTAALLECIRGDIFLQDSKPALDLVEIGRAVSERVSAAGAQTPVVWGLNLYGPSSFCKNPHAGTGNAPLRSVLVGWPDANTTAAIRAGLPRLWEPYVAIPTRWEPRAFLDRLTPLLSDLQADPVVLIDFSCRVSEACAAQARDSRDRFREIEVKAACAVATLPFSAEPKIAVYLASCCAEIAVLVEHAIGDVVESVDSYRYALVTGGMGDLYYLPIRLSKLLGWAGYAVHARLAVGLDAELAATRLADLFARIFETYSLSLVAMSDCQAPYVISALTASARVGLDEEAERMLGHMFTSAVSCGGRVARADLDPSKVLGYLVARSNQPAQPNIEMVAQPTEFVIALLRLSSLFDLADEFDSSLHHLDHLALNAYLPEDYGQFGVEHIAGGTNAVFQVGHDFWRVSDLEAAWPNFPSPGSSGTAMASLLACLLFPDRSPWFLLPVPSLIEGHSDRITTSGTSSSAGPVGES